MTKKPANLKVAMSIALLSIALRAQTQQATANHFYDIVRDDSVLMYAHTSLGFTESSCANFTRQTRMTADGNFTGPFLDIGKNDTLFAKGSYSAGAKEGAFEEFFPNGVLKLKGSYTNNQPGGRWESFYNNGSRERVIDFAGADTLLVFFADGKGNQMVVNGNGRFEGPVEMNRERFSGKGEVSSGKRVGAWRFFGTGLKKTFLFSTEEFEAGKFVSGKYFDNPVYPHKSLFFIGDTPTFTVLEKFTFIRCENIAPIPAESARLKNPGIFFSNLKTMLSVPDGYFAGSIQIGIVFTVMENGKVSNVQIVKGAYNAASSRVATVIRRSLWLPLKSNKVPVAQNQYLEIGYINVGAGGWQAQYKITPNGRP